MSDELMQELQAAMGNLKPQAAEGGGQTSVPVDWEAELSKLPQTADVGVSPPPNGGGLFTPEEEQYMQGKLVRPGYLSAFTGGVERNWGQIKAIAPTIKGMYAEATGDQAGAQQAFTESEQLTNAGPKQIIPNFTYIHDWDDFSTWLSERLGEQSLTMLSMAATGGAGGLSANLAGRGLMMSGASRAALTKFGAGAGAFGGATALETSGTAQELREATGSYNVPTALAAGAIKGGLEIYTPAMLIRGLSQPGRRLATEVGKHAMREGLTEAAQEAVDVSARKYADPNFTFFSTDNAVRIAEAGLTGFAVGGVYGGAGEVIGRKIVRGEKPGSERELTPEEIQSYQKQAEAEKEASRPDLRVTGPLGWLRDKFLRRSERSEDSFLENDIVSRNDPLDVAMTVADLKKDAYYHKIDAELVGKLDDLVDDATPRYVLMRGDGKSDGRLYTATDLETAQALVPQGEKVTAVKVDMQRLAPGHITAEVRDLPLDENDKRIYFLPGTTPEEQASLRGKYSSIIPLIHEAQREYLLPGGFVKAAELLKPYNELLKSGLRVIPERKQSFHYSGELHGERVDPASIKSFRGVQRVGVTHIENGKIKAGRPLITDAKGDDAVAPVVMDWSKIDSNDVVAVPSYAELAQITPENLVVPKDVLYTQAYARIQKVVDGTFADVEKRTRLMLALAEEGIYINDTTSFKVMTLRRDVSIRDATFGPVDYPGTVISSVIQRDKVQQGLPQLAEMRSNIHQPDTPEAQATRKKLLNKISAVLPYINGITDRLGMPRISILVEDENASSSPAVYMKNLLISFPTKGLLPVDQITPAQLTSVLLHEIGHVFTIWNWSKLPASIQNQVERGYQLSKISQRMTDYGTRSGVPGLLPFKEYTLHGKYWATQSEYFAEQFRRWAEEKLQVLHREDTFFSEVAKGLNTLSDEYVKNIWPELQKNFTQAERGFHSWMNYFEGLRAADPTNVRGLFKARANMNVVQLLFKPDVSERHQVAELRSVKKLITKTLENFRHLLPTEWSAEMVTPDSETSFDQAVAGSADMGNKVIRIIASQLSTQNRVDIPTTFIHETLHATWSRLTRTEQEMLIDEAYKYKIEHDEVWYRTYYTETFKLNGFDPTNDAALQATIQDLVDEELVAKFFELYVRNKVGDGKARTIFDAVQQMMGEISEYVNGEFASIDDLMRAFYRGEIARREDPEIAEQAFVSQAQLAVFDPKTIWHREQQISEIKKGREIDDARAVKALTGEDTGNGVSDFDRIAAQTAKREQQQAANILGIPFNQAAPSQMETENIKAIFGQVWRGENNPTVNRQLAGQSTQIGAQADRISWFSKLFYGLHQLAWRNQHIEPLRNYVNLAERWNTARMQWIARADETARKWDKLPATQRDALSDVLFWATEMRYRTPTEVRQGVVRQPTQQELMQAFRQRRMTRDSINLYNEVLTRFNDFIADVERVTRQNILATIRDPAMQQRALLELAADMAQMRKKPYFPMVRFGEWTITVRDPAAKDAVVWFSAYASSAERDAAVRSIAMRFNQHRIQVGRIIEEAHEFMGLPAPLLKQIKNNLPGISQAQQDWIDRLMHLNAPEQSFRKRWLNRTGTPGYSLDAFRAFAHYFVKGGNYLARIEYNKPLNDQITVLRNTLPSIRDTYRRGLMIEYMQKHHRYIMEGGQDWSKLKALFAIWQLGYSPVAAGMNLMQNVQVSWPYFTSLFGHAKASASMMKAMANLRRTFTFSTVGQSQAFIAAKEELIQQGKIDVGQAPELGNFAEGNRLSRLMAGNELQRAWRSFLYYGMIGFQYTEKFNRNLTFAVAWDLANANPNLPILRRIAAHRIDEVFDISARRGLTHEQAAAVIFAREAIDRTQFIYSPLSRPPFLRSGPMSAFMVFFGYMQSMLYAMRHNPGAAKMWLISLGLFGLAGLPGSDDLNELIKLAARRGLGINFNPQKEMRKFVHSITRGTIFDQVGPDLAMHGISRYSFGMGLMAEGWGVPRFDASVNGSMAKIVPGLAELARNLSTVSHQSTWKDVTADLAKNVAGAGFGQMFALLKFLQAPPGSDEWKKWEGILPRAAKAVSKAYRYASKGEETTSTGAKFVGFNVRDPDDRATIIAQALGFNPTKVTAKWEAVLSVSDDIKFYQSRRLSLLAQLDDAVRTKDVQGIKDINKAIVDYNKEMKTLNLVGLGLDGDIIRQSLQMRARNRIQMELDIPQMKKTLPFVQEQRKLWPDVPGPMKVK